jgi:Zn-dependent protease
MAHVQLGRSTARRPSPVTPSVKITVAELRCYSEPVMKSHGGQVSPLAARGEGSPTLGPAGTTAPSEVGPPSLAATSDPDPAARPVPARPRRWGAGIVAALVFLLLKAKSLLVLLKALPAAKFLVTTLSMLAMVAFEAQRSGLWFGVGFVMMILVHELGHGYAMKTQGIVAGWPIFIPFVGAMIAMKSAPRDRHAEAVIAYGGPLAGTAVAALAAVAGLVLDSRLLLALAYTGFFLNLFNLTPLSPLDGGRVAQAFSRRAWWVGVAVLAALFLWTHAPQLLLIALLALPRLFGRGSLETERPELEPGLSRTWAARYFGLAAFLATGLYLSGSLLGRS